MFDTSYGPMELNFDKRELYVQRGDLCWPMKQTSKQEWIATNPFTAQEIKIVQLFDCKPGCCRYLVFWSARQPKPIGQTKEVPLC